MTRSQGAKPSQEIPAQDGVLREDVEVIPAVGGRGCHRHLFAAHRDAIHSYGPLRHAGAGPTVDGVRLASGSTAVGRVLLLLLQWLTHGGFLTTV